MRKAPGMSLQAGSRNPTNLANLAWFRRCSPPAKLKRTTGIGRVRGAAGIFRLTVSLLPFLAAAAAVQARGDDQWLPPAQTQAGQTLLSRHAVELAADLPLDASRQLPVFSGVAASPSVFLDASLPQPSPSHRSTIDGRYVACLAADQDTAAALLRQRAKTLAAVYRQEKDDARRIAATISIALNRQAERQRDVAAANGLRAYYTRIAIALQLSLLDESQQLLDTQQAKQQALLQQGIASGMDSGSFARRGLEVTDQRLQLESQARQLRSLLARLTTLDFGLDEVNHESLDVREQPLDCDWLKNYALNQRSDLQAWNELARCINADTVEQLVKLLPMLAGGWSLPLPAVGLVKRLWCAPDHERLAADLLREVGLVEQTLAAAVEQSVDERCERVVLGYQRLQLAELEVVSWQQRIEQLTALQAQGETKPEQRALAEGAWLTARGTQIQRRLEVRLAEIDLAEAAGQLAARCCRGDAWLVVGPVGLRRE